MGQLVVAFKKRDKCVHGFPRKESDIKGKEIWDKKGCSESDYAKGLSPVSKGKSCAAK